MIRAIVFIITVFIAMATYLSGWDSVAMLIWFLAGFQIARGICVMDHEGLKP